MKTTMTTEARVFAHQRGQSTVEFAVLALVLVPLLLIVPLLGKYLDLAQTTAVASRYAAFEGTVRHSSSTAGWKPEAALADEVRRRFFSASDAPVKSADVAGDFAAHRNPLWHDNRGDPLLPAFAGNVGVSATSASLSQPFGAFHASAFGLSHGNLHTGRVTVRPAAVAGLQPFDALGLSISRSTTVLVDPWAAGGPDQVATSITRDGWNLIGPFPYRPLETVVNAIELAIQLIPLEGNLPKVGRIEPDRVPLDRFK